ncbi:IclR family transcriptional regulator [Kitasatospora sp. MMS16-BH015]|uniref:helix-turn-helix domain-containing protein n=1 Tax=Kitasatospora sp. MMS16-BH015 TaxID=2018025 RepID=UPI000CA38203|nr:helix-turn-helix domain-containing protein [Kitasatospora sp. MMS16-BH015]AUG78262.1 IclR family transcriptional regulator [Kitasatospora sp. MMS16-BH015]
MLTSTTPAPRRRDSMLARGLALLNSFGPDDLELSLSELARRAELPKPTAHRLVGELLDSGFLERGQVGLQLGPQMHVLGVRSSREQRIRILARPLLQRLHGISGATAYLSVPRGPEIVHLLREGAVGPEDEARDWTARQSARRLFHAVAQGADQSTAGRLVRTPEIPPPAAPGTRSARTPDLAAAAAAAGLAGRAVRPSGPAAAGAGRPGRPVEAAAPRGGVVAARRLGPAVDAAGRSRTPVSVGPVVSLADAQQAQSVLACSVRVDGAGLLAALCLVGVADAGDRRGSAAALRDTARTLTARLSAQLDPRAYSGTA